MKKSLIFTLLCLPFFAVAQFEEPQFDHKIEQNTDGNKFLNDMQRRFGAQLILGFNASQIDGDGMEGFHKFSLNGGVRGLVNWSPKLSTSIDLLFSQKGAQRVALDNPILSRVDLDYVEVPIMMQYRDWRFQFGAGVSYARLVNFKVIDLDRNDVTAAYTPRASDVNWLVGGTLFLTKKWGINVQYQRSVFSVLEGGGWNSFHWTARAVYQL